MTSHPGGGRGAACVALRERPVVLCGSAVKPWGPSPSRNANILKTQLKFLGPGAGRRVSTDFCRFSPKLRLLPGRAARPWLSVPALCVPGSYPAAGSPGFGRVLLIVS